MGGARKECLESSIRGLAGHSGKSRGEEKDKELGLSGQRPPGKAPRRAVFREGRWHGTCPRTLIAAALGQGSV